jgi:MarR family transcriptional regulator, multiple antibiotic resistance protein MarR
MSRMNPPRTAAVPVANAPVAETTSADPGHGVIRLINRIRVEMIDALDRELAQFDISAPQLIVLASMANNEADSAARLCKSISYDPGAMTRMIDRLEQKGLIRRSPNPDDRRAMNLEITTAGRALYPQLLAAKGRVQAQFLRGFSKDEARLLDSFLNRMLENR